MAANYFTPERAWKHLFFINGLTADEFYTDGGLRMNIEELTHQELKRSGYERVVFYDKDYKLYCYDEESYALLRTNGEARCAAAQPVGVRPVRRRGGLRMGKLGRESGVDAPEGPAEAPPAEPDSRWVPGERSNVGIRRTGARMDLGMVDNTFIKRQIDAYMFDPLIKTAVVINDAGSFLREFGDDPMHALTAGYERMGSDNENLLVFIYTDDALANIYAAAEHDERGRDANTVTIECPNLAELRNMLMYFRVRYGLRVRPSQLTDVAAALRQAMASGKKGVRIKEVYQRLRAFGTDKELTPDGCYPLLGVEKPVPARVQLERLIGMDALKKELAKFDVGAPDPGRALTYLTASRLQPDLPRPERRDELIHFILTGNPGTGKTTAAKLLGQLFYEMGYLESGHVRETNRSELVSNHVGETALWTARRVEEAMGGVLFIDEAYTLKRQRNTGGDFGQEAIDTLVKLMDQYKGKFIVIFAGYEREMETFAQSNPGLESRCRRLHIDDYTPDEMRRILEFHAARAGFAFSDELRAALPDFCENWVNLAGEDWGNAREAVKLIDDMEKNYKRDKTAGTRTDADGRAVRVLEKRHIPEELAGHLRPVAEQRGEALRRLNAMTGLDGVKRQIERLRLRMLAGDMTVPGHYIFAGNPGTGKTTVARYMGHILRSLGLLRRGHMKEYTATELMSRVFGEEAHGDFSAVAREAMDGVLFIDEAYQLHTDTTGRGRAILDAMVPFLSDNAANICVIFAGYEDDMENLLEYNPGFKSRFAETIYFENYTGAQLHSILLEALSARGIEADDDYRELSLRALTRYVELHGKRRDFGNARYVVNTFLPASLDAQTRRLVDEYGEDFPRELKKQLTGRDIPEDLVRLTKVPLPKPDTRPAAEKIESLVGYGKIKEELRRLIKNAKYNRENEFAISGMPERLHWVLEGGPGTGKTKIAKLIGQVYRECGILPKGHTHKVTRADLVGQYQGWTTDRTRRAIEKAMGGVLFIDEAYSLVASEGAEGSGYGHEAIAELVEAMESMNGEFAVVLAGYPNEMEEFLKSNSGLSSRAKKFVLEDYTPDELARIFRQMCAEQKALCAPELDEALPAFFANMKARESKLRDWGNAREAENLLRDMLTLWADDQELGTDADGAPVRVLTERHIPEALRRYLKGRKAAKARELTALEEIDRLIGFEEIKTKLRELLALGTVGRAEGMEDLLEDLTLHWVLRGNPGTGKTTIAELIGKVYKELGVLSRGHTVKVTRADLVAEYTGQTAPKTRKCVERALGGVLFIDEAYSLRRAGDIQDSFGQEAIETLLEQMSARNGEFAVIAAGYPREMDVFLNANPGFRSRFGEDFLIADYTAAELAKIFELKCRGKKFAIADDLREVVEPMFANMIAARIKGWANGREAENLEKALRKQWGRDPMIVRGEDGEKQRFYALRHLPESYRRYLPGAQPGKPAAPAPGKQKPAPAPRAAGELSIPRAELAQPVKEFRYEEQFLTQTHALALIRARSKNAIGSGTGSILTKEGHILTCHHVINGAERINVRLKLPGGDGVRTVWEEADVVWADADLDAAVIKIAPGDYPTLPMRPLSVKPQTGEAIYHWGFPFAGKLADDLNELQPSLFQGFISSVQVKDGLDRVNTNMEAKRGCSGGPVFAKKDGAILGILCGSQMSGDEHLMEEMNYVLPIRYVWEYAVESEQPAAEALPETETHAEAEAQPEAETQPEAEALPEEKEQEGHE